jgi:hypothetical protein
MTKFISLGARAFPPLIAVTMLGCYAEPYCAVNGVVDGNFSGQIAWRGAGEGECSMSVLEGIEMAAGADRISIAPEGGYLALTTIGAYPEMAVTFTSAGKEWYAAGCQVNIVSVIREDWTRSDYLYITGSLVCPTLVSPEASPIDLVGVAFTGYFIEDSLDF